MRWGTLLVCFVCIFSFPVFADEDVGALIASIATLQRNADKAWPEHLTKGEVKKGTEFDVNEYFKYFKHITPPKGQKLDYTFCGFSDGRPIVYWMDSTSSILKTCDQLKDIMYSGANLNELSSQLTLDESNDAYYEFLIFSILADKFYLSWHSGYNEIWLIATKAAVEDIIREVNTDNFGSNFDEKQMAAARALDVAPTIDVSNKEFVVVSVVTFSRWRGFERVTKKILRSSPHIVLEAKSQNLLKYNCQVMF